MSKRLGHMAWNVEDKKVRKELIRFLRTRIIYPTTPIHVRRKTHVVVNAKYLIESLRLYELGQVYKGNIQPHQTFLFKF